MTLLLVMLVVLTTEVCAVLAGASFLHVGVIEKGVLSGIVLMYWLYRPRSVESAE